MINLSNLVIASRGYLSSFDYDHYPENFRLFEEAAAPLYATLSGMDHTAEAVRMIEELEQQRESLPRSARRETADMDKRVLALFLAPAARRYGGAAEAFVQVLQEKWNARYPRNTFLAGDYEVIMKGFDSNLLGLPLRKSKFNR